MSKSAGKKLELVAMGLKLKELREEKKLSQKEAYIALGLTSQSILSSYELGDREPHFSTINNIARYYGVTVDYLTGNSYVRNSDNENLSKALPFDEKTITKILQLSQNTNGMFEEIISLNSFPMFLMLLKKYQYMPIQQVDKFYDLLYPEEIGVNELKRIVMRSDLKKDIVKPTLHKILEDMLKDLDGNKLPILDEEDILALAARKKFRENK